MPRGRPRKVVDEDTEIVGEETDEGTGEVLEEPTLEPVNPELEDLRSLHAELKALGINSISDLEVKIARLS